MREEQFKVLTTYLENIQSNTNAIFEDRNTVADETLKRYSEIMTSMSALIAEVKIATEELKKAREVFYKGSKNIEQGFENIQDNVVEVLKSPPKKLTWKDKLYMLFKGSNNGQHSKSTQQVRREKVVA